MNTNKTLVSIEIGKPNMFCFKCGNEVPEEAGFCPRCGTSLSAITSDAVVLTASVENVPDDNLLSSLEEFQAGFHDLEKLGVEVDRLKKNYDRIERRGAQWYYDNSNDERIVASRAINAQIDRANGSIAQCRQTLGDNEERRQEATRERNRQMSKAAGAQHRADVAHTGKTGCAAIVYGFIAFISFGMIVTGFGVSQGREMFFIVGAIGLVVSIVLFTRGMLKREKKTENKKVAAQARAVDAQSEFEATMTDLAAQDVTTWNEINTLDTRLQQLVPRAGKLREEAMEKANYCYNSDMYTQGLALRDASNAFVQRYQYLKQLGTIPDERDWGGIDQIVGYVKSGRADTLKEALQLLSQERFQQQLLGYQQAILEAQEMTNSILAEGFTSMLSKQEALIEQQRNLFDAQTELQMQQHAQQMTAQAEQLAFQAEQLNQEAQIRANQETAYSAQQAAYNEQAAFFDEVRSQPGWVDPENQK